MIAIAKPRNRKTTPLPPSTPTLHSISPSGMKSYLSCPAKFYYEKILRVETKVTPSLQLGRSFHAAMAGFQRSVMRADPMPAEEVKEILRCDLLMAEEVVEYSNQAEADRILLKGDSLIDSFFESDLSCDGREVLGVEAHLQDQVKDSNITLQGIADLIVAEEGNLVAVDFKTTASTPDPDLESWLNEIQLVAYVRLLESSLNEKAEHCELWFFVKTKVPKVIRHRLPKVSKVQRERFDQLLTKVIEGIGRGDFAPQPSFACRFCDFRNRCQSWKGGLPS